MLLDLAHKKDEDMSLLTIQNGLEELPKTRMGVHCEGQTEHRHPGQVSEQLLFQSFVVST